MTGTLRRGFKAEANWWSQKFRLEMGVETHLPLCPWSLAAHLDVPVINASRIVDPNIASYLASDLGNREISAMACSLGVKSMIIVNDTHMIKRLASDVAHELAHIILRHPPENPLHADGTRKFNAEIEAEANWLGPALLLSEEAALYACSKISSGQITLPAFSDRHRISEDVIRMRMNVVGAYRRVRAA